MGALLVPLVYLPAQPPPPPPWPGSRQLSLWLCRHCSPAHPAPLLPPCPCSQLLLKRIVAARQYKQQEVVVEAMLLLYRR